MKCIRAFALLLVLGAAPTAFANQSLPVSGAIDSAGRKVLTIVNKDPSGVRCNGNVQVAAGIANTYRVPIQILPASLDMEGTATQPKTGLIHPDKVRKELEGFKSTI